MLMILGLLACPSESTDSPEPELDVEVAQLASPKYVTLFGVLPDDLYEEEVPDAALVNLGRMLYFDARLSNGERFSCNSCHDLARYGTVPAQVSGPETESRPARNAPSTYNTGLLFRQYWDGRVDTLEAQTLEVFTDPQQMGMPTQSAVLNAIQAIPGYRDAFAAAFPGDASPIRYGTVAKALVAFERSLVTTGSPLDRYLQGDETALNAQELAGFDRFVEVGCVSCHSGAMVGGGMFQRLGAVHPYPTKDLGRGLVTLDDEDAQIFRVPSLRNVAETGPWLHDGSVGSLEEVVRLMGHHQLGRDLADEDVASIVRFLKTLTAPLPPDASVVPELP